MVEHVVLKQDQPPLPHRQEVIVAKLEAEPLVRSSIELEDHVRVKPVRRASPEARTRLIDSEKGHIAGKLQQLRRRCRRRPCYALRQGSLRRYYLASKIVKLTLAAGALVRVLVPSADSRAIC